MAYPNQYTPSSAPAPQANQTVQQLSLPIFQARGWLKFLGVISIISGVGSALSIVGILVRLVAHLDGCAHVPGRFFD